MKPKFGRFGLFPSFVFTLALSSSLSHTANAASGTWSNLASGSWADSANWSSGVIADGTDSTADFSTLNLTADATVTLDGARTIGGLLFGDATTPSNNWVLNTGTLGPLTLSTTAGIPAISVVNQTATIGAVLAGTQGLTKTGAGTLVLSGTNTYTGTTTISAGILSISADTNLGTPPGAATPGSLVLNGGKLAVTANNITLSPNRGIALGASGGEIVTPNVSQTTTYAGIITGAAGTGALTYTGSGDIALGGASTYTGGTTINSGRIRIGTATALGTGIVTINGSGGTGGQVYTSTAVTFANSFVISGFGGNSNDTVQRGAIRLDGSTINGTVTLAANAGIDANSGTGTVNGIVSGAFNLTINKSDAGTIALGGNNTYSGGTTLNGGTLRVANSDNALGTGALTFTANSTLATASGGGARNLANAMVINSGLTASFDGGFASLGLGGNISGAGNLTVASSGLVTLSGTNTYGGATAVNGGYLLFANAGAVPSGTSITIASGGSLVAAGVQTTVQGWLASGKVVNTSAGAIAIAGDSSENIDFTAGGFNALGLSSLGDAVYSGTITPGTGGYKFGGASGILTVTQPLVGTSALSKVGGSVLVLSGANTYSGATTISAGQVFVTGSLANAGGLTVSGGSVSILNGGSITGGTITAGAGQIITNSLSSIGTAGSTINLTAGTAGTGLVYTGTGETTDRIVRYNSGSAGGLITNNGTGLLTFSNAATTTATAAFGITLNGIGSGQFVGVTQPGTPVLINFNKLDPGNWTVTGLNNLNGGAFRADGGVLSFAATATTGSGAAAATISRNIANGGVLKIASGASVITSTANTNSILGGWATFDNTTWAVTNGNAAAITGLGTFATDTWAAGSNTDVTLAGANPASGSTTNSLRFSAAGVKTLTLGGANVVTSGGILVTSTVGAADTTITGGTSIAGGITNGDVIVHQNNTGGKLIINSVIAANGTGGLTKAGAGTLDLGAVNTYTGTTFVDEGILNLNIGGGAGTLRGAVTIAQGARVRVTVADGLGNSQGTRAGSINLAGGTLDIQNTGNNSLTSLGVTMTAGTLTGVASSKIDFRNNGNGDTNITTNAAGATSVVSIPTLGSAGGSITLTTAKGLTPSGIDLSVSSAIINDAGTGGAGGGTHNLTKAGAGTALLTGANTYTGTTNVSAGTLMLGTGGTFGTGVVSNFANIAFTSTGTTTVPNVISGNGAVLQSGSGTTVYTGANTYSGLTTITAGTLQIGNGGTTGTLGAGAVANGGTLAFNRADTVTLSNVITGNGAIIKDGTGTLNLDYSVANTSKLPDGSALNLRNGTLNLVGGSHTEVVAGTTVSGFASITRSSGTSTLSLGNITYTSGNLDIAAPGLATTTSPNVNGLLPGVTLQGALAMNDGSGNIVAAALSFTDTTRMSGAIANGGAQNIRIIEGGAAGNITVAAGTTDINTLTNSAAGGLATVNVGAGNTLRLAAAGHIIANAGSGGLTFTGGTLTAGGATNVGGSVIIDNASANPVSIGSVIANNGTGVVSVGKFGTGPAVLSGANTYTGATSITAGALNIQNATALGTTASGTTITPGAALEIQGGITVGAETLSLSGAGVSGNGALRNISGNNTYGGVLTLGGSTQIQSDAGTLTITPAIAGGLGKTLTKTGTGGLTLNGGGASALPTTIVVNQGTLTMGGGAFGVDKMAGSGLVTVNAGATLAISAAHALGGDNGTFTESVVINGGTMTMNNEQYFSSLTLTGATVNGANEIRTSTASNIVVNGSAATTISSNVNLFNAGNFNVSDVTGNASADLTITGAIANTGALNKSGSGTMLLTGTNTYSGVTTIAAGVLQAGNGGTTGSLGTNTVTNNASLVINRSNAVTLAAVISGTGSLTQAGAGTTELSAVNTYTGDTIVTGGVLQVDNAFLADASAVRLSTGAAINLNHALTDTIDKLYINGELQASGTWGPIGSMADHTSALITGTGLLQVTTGGTPYVNWASLKGLTTGVNDGVTQDPDNDGRNNLYEFAFDGNPLSGAADGKMISKVSNVGGAPVLTITLPVRTSAVFAGGDFEEVSLAQDGVIYHIQGSIDLTNWILNVDPITDPTDLANAQGSIAVDHPLDGGWSYRSFYIPGSDPGANGKVFIRAKVEQP